MGEDNRESQGTPVSNVVQIDEERIRGHLDRIVRSSVEETLNGLLDAEADRLVGADRISARISAGTTAQAITSASCTPRPEK